QTGITIAYIEIREHRSRPLGDRYEGGRHVYLGEIKGFSDGRAHRGRAAEASAQIDHQRGRQGDGVVEGEAIRRVGSGAVAGQRGRVAVIVEGYIASLLVGELY